MDALWIKFKKQKPPQGVTVKIKWGDGTIIDGKRVNNFMSWDVLAINGKTFISGMIEWSLK
jgi:hypothetical protein